MSRSTCIAGALLGLMLSTTVFTTMGTRSMADDAKADPKLVHNVYFTLKDGSPANVQKLTDACYKYLDKHDGVVCFAAGTVVAEFDRPVNQKDFHVGLCVVFKNKAAHDVYQTHPRHIDFITENKETWATVRVFDSWAR
ncbi:MAG: Dabb family protein [Planctomycetaceae bacterium]|nr:Dabb family protein [Planctomycetaceae bacterium]